MRFFMQIHQMGDVNREKHILAAGEPKITKEIHVFVCFVAGALRDGKQLIFMEIIEFNQTSRNSTHFHENL